MFIHNQQVFKVKLVTNNFTPGISAIVIPTLK